MPAHLGTFRHGAPESKIYSMYTVYHMGRFSVRSSSLYAPKNYLTFQKDKFKHAMVTITQLVYYSVQVSRDEPSSAYNMVVCVQMPPETGLIWFRTSRLYAVIQYHNCDSSSIWFDSIRFEKVYHNCDSRSIRARFDTIWGRFKHSTKNEHVHSFQSSNGVVANQNEVGGAHFVT